jgi:hypothetical protein
VTIKARTYDQLSNPVVLKRFLAQQLKRGQLVLVIGAGVSMDMGLPGWETLVDKLSGVSGVARDLRLDLRRQAEAIRLAAYRDQPEAFLRAVQRSLYEGLSLDFDKIRRSELLGAVAAISMHGARSWTSSVITFNFDDLLELFLEYHGLEVKALVDPPQWNTRATVLVMHPHGLLPLSPTRQMSSDIVLDQKAFMALINDDRQPWRQLLLTTMRTHTCLFIGLSGTDDHLDSLLLAAADRHCASVESPYWAVACATSDAMDPIWEERGVFVHRLASHTELPDFLFNICQVAAGYDPK